MSGNKMALDALTAIQDAIGMATSGDSSDFVWPKSTMRHPGETAYGWICEKHGLGYQSGCICCAGDLMAYREQKDREARYTREDAIREASKKVRAAIAALRAMDAEARKRGEMYPQTRDEQEADTKAVRNVIESLEFYTSGRQVGANGWPGIKDWPALPVASTVAALKAERDAALARVAELEKDAQDHLDTVQAIFDAIGYTKEYAMQWPKEKASVTFKRWFDEQMRAALTKGQP